MPTGYTAMLIKQENVSFARFALQCARGFGACLLQRDDDFNDLPDPYQKVANYYSRALKETKELLGHVRTLEGQALINYVQAKDEQRYQSSLNSFESMVNENARYALMKREVMAWIPPTHEHEGLKNFMLQQLETSTWKNLTAPVRQNTDPETWKKEEIQRLEQKIVYYENQIQEEEARVAGRNKWIRDLYTSLNFPLPPES